MTKNKRWRQPYIDTRDWSTYNERLVKRGEFYLSLDFIRCWDRDLATLNIRKQGRPFQYPSLFIEWMACIHIFLQMPYRQREGFTRQLATFLPALKSADYTTLFRRIQRMDITISVNPAMLSRDLVVAVDSTGLKVTNRGEWMREKWKVRRGWIKVHAMIDVETNQILNLEVTDETTQDDRVFEMLLDKVEQNCDGTSVKSVLGDGAYDRNHCFNELEKRGIHSGIKTRINASQKSSGSPNRAECVRERDDLGGYRPWAEKVNYGMRWKVEGLFSSIKRIFGESVRASSREGMFREAQMKFRGYNILLA